jgi:protoporphyrinogen oxidase
MGAAGLGKTTRPPVTTVILGGGLAGLTAAYDLARAGRPVTVLEREPAFGGLASAFRLEGIPVERFYHFLCRYDRHVLALAAETGLQPRWRAIRTAFFYSGRHYPFGRPGDLLRFSPVPFAQRVRFGWNILRSYYRRQWQWLDEFPARAWLIEDIGEEAYRVIWQPLLRVKFGPAHTRISAAWMWHRIWRVAKSRASLLSREQFGCFEAGSESLIDALVERLRAQPRVTLRADSPAAEVLIDEGQVAGVRVGPETIPCRALISTMALPALNALLREPAGPYFAGARSIQYIGVVCLVLSLRRPFSRNFWLNVNDPQVSFNGIIEQTNLNEAWRRAGLHVLYVPFYLPTTESRYHASGEALLAEYMPMLQRMAPEFDATWIKEWRVFREPYAQAVCTAPFLPSVPEIRTPIRGLYVTDSTQFYPEDRTLNAAVRQGRRAAQLCLADEPAA